MVFSSSVFLFAFLPISFILYFIPISRKKGIEIAKKNLILLIVSLIFYAWGEPTYIILMVISIFFNYVVGIDIEHLFEKGKKKHAKVIFIFAVVVNLFLLGYFKYSGFIIDNINGTIPNQN